MMNMDAVIGCASVEANDAWLRLKTAGGALRTIPWSAVSVAGLSSGQSFKIEIQGVTEKVAPYLLTHDSLWILWGDRALAQVMIEKDGPARAALLAAFADRLGDRWHGDRLSMNELTTLLFKMPAAVKMPKFLVVIMILMGLGVLAATVVLLLVKGK
jgi:hypothetical protein